MKKWKKWFRKLLDFFTFKKEYNQHDDLLYEAKALGSGCLGSGVIDTNFKPSIIHIEQVTEEQLLPETIPQMINVEVVSVPIDDLHNRYSNSFHESDSSIAIQDVKFDTLGRKRLQKRDSYEISFKPLVDLTPENVIIKGTLLDSIGKDKGLKPSLEPKNPNRYLEGKAGEMTDDDITSSKSLSRKSVKSKLIDSDIELSRSRSRRKMELDSDQDNEPLLALSRRLTRKKSTVSQRKLGTEEVGNSPDEDIDVSRKNKRLISKSFRNSIEKKVMSKSIRSSSRHRKRFEEDSRPDSDFTMNSDHVDDDDDTPLANYALQALQQNLAAGNVKSRANI
jgi:hypothetical protein